MKAIKKKILLANLTIGILTPFIGGVAVSATSVEPSESSNNEVEINEDKYTINGEITDMNEGYHTGYRSVSGSKFSDAAEDATNNTLTINGNIYFTGNIYGGYSENGNATNNTVNLNGGNTAYYLIGGRSINGNAENNILNIYNGSFGTIYGGRSDYANASGNIVNVNVNNDDHVYHVFGTCYGGLSESGNVTDNIVNINSGSGDNCYGGRSKTGNVTDNTVNINGGTIGTMDRNIYGGYSENGDAINNTVNITGGTLKGLIFAGDSRNGNVINNTVNIYGNPDLKSATLLGGGVTTNGYHSGNTLNIYTKGLTAENIQRFQAINFYLPENTVNGDTILNLTSTYTNITGVDIKVGVVGNANLNPGDTVILLKNARTTNNIDDTKDIFGDNGGITTYSKLTEGVSLEYDLNISHRAAYGDIVATVGGVSSQNTNVTLKPEVNSLPLSSGIAGVETANNALDMPTIEDDDDTDADNNSANVATQIAEIRGWEVFANAGGGSLRFKGSDGAHVDMTTQSINLGFARSLEQSSGKFTIAPIIDYVNGNYDSYLEFGTHGSGKTRYIAGGLIARRMLQNGFYYEGSVRVGKVKTDFASDNIDKTGAFGRVTYDTSATTLAGHLKIGKAFRLNKNNFLDVYGVYYHAHQGGMDADLSSGEHYNFSSANSGRLRIGYRWTTRANDISKFYTGLAYQYEHSSGVTANYKTYSTPGAGESGSSGMLEFGWIVKPIKALPWAIDINATGWIGHQRGITAMAKISKAF